jgi:tetratricopeptide (TPR) repeat protein
MVLAVESLFRISSSLLLFVAPGILHQHHNDAFASSTTGIGILEQQSPDVGGVVSSSQVSPSSLLSEGISTWMIASAKPEPPSASDISKLQRAVAQFYGVDRDLVTSEQLLTEVIEIWKDQPLDEQAGLYRVRADCYMLLGQPEKALEDYNKAITFLETKEGADALDPNELPIALLGRARASKMLASSSTTTASSENYAKLAAIDYRRYLIATSREEWDTDMENIEDGATRNPYAAWEWADSLRISAGGNKNNNEKDRESSAQAFTIASTAFREIGDIPRSVISALDAGIQLAASVTDDKSNSAAEAERILKTAIASTKGIESRDVSLLQRVIIKEGEAGVALAAFLWNDNQKPEAEQVLGNTCLRLEQLQQKIIEKQKSSTKKTEVVVASTTDATTAPPKKLLYSIDDDERNIGQLDCGQFRNPSFVQDTLGWPPSLQDKVRKLQTLR